MKTKKQLKNRILSLVLALVMVVGMLPMSTLTAFAADDDQTTENITCYCVEKCTEDTLNVWCDVCGVQGEDACRGGADEAVTYQETDG